MCLKIAAAVEKAAVVEGGGGEMKKSRLFRKLPGWR